MIWEIREGDCRDLLSELPDRSVQTCITSPPYFGLRDYGHDGQIGLESTPDAFVAEIVDVFAEVRRVLRDDGTLWLNLGDSYAGSWGAQSRGQSPTSQLSKSTMSAQQIAAHPKGRTRTGSIPPGASYKAKDLLGIPWMVAFALRADGWYLRSDIVWAKPNPMPESVTDRPTRSHEHIFLLSKRPRYYYDHDAIREESTGRKSGNGFVRDHRVSYQNADGTGRGSEDQWTGERAQTKRAREIAEQHGLTEAHFAAIRACGVGDAGKAQVTQDGYGNNASDVQALADEAKAALGGYYREFLIPLGGRNRRDVWSVPTMPFAGAHFATFPPKLIEPCVLAGAPEGGLVLDPFAGAGTTGLVALRRQRNFIGFELNPDYAEMARQRIRDDAPLMNTIAEVAA